MQIIHLKHRERTFEFAECGLCLGNFDGVHLGHRALIRELQRLNSGRRERLPLGALCFKQPPTAILNPDSPVPQLTTLDEKLDLLQQAGLQFAILYDFEELRNMSPDDFVMHVLIRDCRCRIAVCGFNYTYGARGEGTAARLMETFGSQPNRTLSVLPAVTDGKITVSSTAIRTMLENGHPEDATRLLGHPFCITGRVENGRQIGSALGFPTANLTFPTGGIIPAHGVYASTVKIGRRIYTGITNVGTRPTFEDGDAVTCETFIFDFNGDLYGKTLRVCLLHFLRAERKFASAAELEAQIKQDVETAKEYL